MTELVTTLGGGIATIPADAERIGRGVAQDSLGWISTGGNTDAQGVSAGQIELCRGRELLGAEETTNGYVEGHGFGYKADGTAVQFRKVNTKIQYYNSATSLWVDTITGLTDSAEYTFSPYQSLAGTFIYATGVDGIFKIHTANPGNYASMYDSIKNFKGKSIIVTSRMTMWDLPNDKTGLYGSYIDAQNSTVYTTVTGEVLGSGDGATTVFSGTLAFKGGDAKRSAFGIAVTVTAGETFTDNYNGVLTGSAGGTGTINYMTGAWTLTFVVPPAIGVSNITATYQWEMTNNHGITDFTHQASRVAGEGFVFRQDEGGDAILKNDYHKGSYYSEKSRSVYQLTIGNDDITATNIVFRKNIGIPYWQATVETSQGIVFMDTANPDKPQLTILQPTIYTGDILVPTVLCTQFNFANYYWDQCCMGTFGEYIIFSGRTKASATNDKLFLYNNRRQTIDILPYATKTLASNAGLLYIGDTITDNVYQILSGFDDDNDLIDNFWISNDELFQTERLKKARRIRLKGLITASQSLQVYFSPDGSAFTLVGTILGNGSYVDFSNNYAIGSSGIGEGIIGGEADTTNGSRYLCELKLSQTKFRKRTIKLIATGIGYISVDLMLDEQIRTFENKLPPQYQTKTNVSLDGTQTNLPNPV